MGNHTDDCGICGRDQRLALADCKHAVYTVNQVANRPRSDFPGYAQSFYAYNADGDFAAAHLDSGWDDKDPANTFTNVLTREVAGVDGHHAIMRFRQWQATGKAESWLRSGT